jgi:hypothetical protein
MDADERRLKTNIKCLGNLSVFIYVYLRPRPCELIPDFALQADAFDAVVG